MYENEHKNDLETQGIEILTPLIPNNCPLWFHREFKKCKRKWVEKVSEIRISLLYTPSVSY